MVVFVYQRNGLGCNSFAASGESEALGGGCLDGDGLNGNAQVGGDSLSHRVDVGAHFRSLGDDCDVGVGYGPAFAVEEVADSAEEFAGVDVLPLRVGVGEVCADVAEGGGAEECVDECVDGNVSVAVAEEAFVGGDVHASDDAGAPFDEAMDVEACADAEGRDAGSSHFEGAVLKFFSGVCRGGP